MKAILFDFDETLAYMDRKLGSKGLCEVLRSWGYELYYEEFDAARNYVVFIDYPKHGLKDSVDYLMKTFHLLSISLEQEHFEEFVRLYDEDTKRKLYPDTYEILPELCKEYKTGIATALPSFRVREALGDLSKFINNIVTGYEAGVNKSHKSFFLNALEKSSTLPLDAVMVGDNVDTDIHVPKLLGMKTIYIDRKTGKKCDDADASIQTLVELKNILTDWRW